MGDLETALEVVGARIAKFGGQPIGEENTKHALIEPILRALGWDLEDLDEVRCEYKLKQADNPVDYALFINHLVSAPQLRRTPWRVLAHRCSQRSFGPSTVRSSRNLS